MDIGDDYMKKIIGLSLILFMAMQILSFLPQKVFMNIEAYADSEKELNNNKINSIEFKGDFIEGKTISVVVKDDKGNDITKNCMIWWYRCDRVENDINKYEPTYIKNGENYEQVDNGVNSINICVDSEYRKNMSANKYKSNSIYRLEKEDIGKYIAVQVYGESKKVYCSNTKVQIGNASSAKWKKEVFDVDTSSWYYLNDDGTIATGWRYINGYWYYFRPQIDGEMSTGFQYIDGAWYYFNGCRQGASGQGKMLTGWIKARERIIKPSKHQGYYSMVKSKGGKNTYYYFYSNGKLAINTTIDGHQVDETGAVTDGYVPENYIEW